MELKITKKGDGVAAVTVWRKETKRIETDRECLCHSGRRKRVYDVRGSKCLTLPFRLAFEISSNIYCLTFNTIAIWSFVITCTLILS